MTFLERLAAAQSDSQSRLCVGLDPDPMRMPPHLAKLPAPEAVTAFCIEIIDATSDYACAFKTNLAFFEALGRAGMQAFEAVVDAVGSERLVIADAKRADIGNTARHYAAAFFDRMRCDAVTVSPYMGRDSLEPFLSYESRATFALVLTSNPGADDLQMLRANGRRIYEHAAEMAAAAGDGLPGTIGFVVGATRSEPLAQLRAAYPSVPFLVPGVGPQGGDAAEVVDAAGAGPLLVSASRSVIYASSGNDFAQAAREAAIELRTDLGPNS